jgi:hypothetical protein
VAAREALAQTKGQQRATKLDIASAINERLVIAFSAGQHSRRKALKSPADGIVAAADFGTDTRVFRRIEGAFDRPADFS